ncbi:GrpE protein [Arcobacter nitrofigilis DSM 7299]|uniref:Protein GrpE n=1 Tax=Arcobacter nitrofigilis (strain ATCC 33309 / DSM 7299 / CCUG 15893 / LMG 7604 / NCTC 12251 / CI) TaxID=572480 RepID=D5V7C8_ARCNC|nr:nucleotide exchange factor GrpE [Arcobacter nitrofigilis]ADG94548.1 GrpE protein [Arcobacter nitrofigilis DSM 7299]
MSKDTENTNNEEIIQEEVETNEECCKDESSCCNEKAASEESKETTAEDKIAELEAKLKETEEKYLRVHADFENIKKRLEKEKYQAIDYASEKFAKDLLSPIDTLEMALAAEEAASNLSSEDLLAKLKEGVELTIKNFYTAFDKHNITVVETDGEFDPNFHNAIMQVDSEDKQTGEIVQVMQKGYMLKERLLRPAMVSIAN